MNTVEIAALAQKAEKLKDHIQALKSPKYDPDYCPEGEEGVPSMLSIYVYRQDVEECDDYSSPSVPIHELDGFMVKTISREAIIAELERQLEVLENKIKTEANA